MCPLRDTVSLNHGLGISLAPPLLALQELQPCAALLVTGLEEVTLLLWEACVKQRCPGGTIPEDWLSQQQLGLLLSQAFPLPLL